VAEPGRFKYDPDSALALYAERQQGKTLRALSYTSLAVSAVLFVALVMGIPSRFIASVDSTSPQTGILFGPPTRVPNPPFAAGVRPKKYLFLGSLSKQRVGARVVDYRRSA